MRIVLAILSLLLELLRLSIDLMVTLLVMAGRAVAWSLVYVVVPLVREITAFLISLINRAGRK